tara:strand:- start:450 stop:677 length:228 start_codon:yes stop_codon:yes gene_type:complete
MIMMELLHKLVFSLILNSTLFLILITGVYNSDKKSKVNFLTQETIDLPISFIVGSSFIAGSVTGGFISFFIRKKD